MHENADARINYTQCFLQFGTCDTKDETTTELEEGDIRSDVETISREVEVNRPFPPVGNHEVP